MTNGITNVVGSQSYNCRLYSRVSLIHSQYNTIHQEVLSSSIFRNDFYSGQRGNKEVCSF